MTEFKPGDVVRALVDDEWVLAVVGHDNILHVFGHSFFKSLAVDNSVYIKEKFHPLAVIDPEDEDVIEGLLRDYYAIWTDTRREGVDLTGGEIGAMQASLREFAAPTPRVCDAILTLGNLRIECERDPGHVTDHRNDSVGQGVRWDS